MKDYQQVVADRYDKEAPAGESIYAPTHPIGKYTREVLFGGLAAFVSRYERLHGRTDDKRLLDVGCGHGEMLHFFTTLGFSPQLATGIDLSETRINSAQERYPELRFICGDGIGFDLPERFDLITSFDMFSHFPSKEELLRGLTTVRNHLTPDGWFLWYDIHSEDHFSSPANADSWGFSKQQMIDLGREAGFEVVEYKPFFKLFFNRWHSVYQVQRLPKGIVKLLEKVLPGKPGNNMVVLRAMK